MEHIAALMLIVSCSGNLQECKELPSPVTVFETMEECQQILPQTLKGFEREKGKIFSTCVTVDPAMEEEDAVLSWDVGKDGILRASVDIPEVTVANVRRENDAVSAQ